MAEETRRNPEVICTVKLTPREGAFACKHIPTGETAAWSIAPRELAERMAEFLRRAGWEVKIE